MTTQNAASLLALLHISSPALPVGAFAYSQGLEYALDKGWCNNRDDVQRWIEHSVEFGLGQLDLPLYLRLYRAWKNQDFAAVNHWNQLLLSFRETKELYLEDIQVGGAFAQWHLGQCEEGQNPERQSYLDHCPQPTVVAMNALAAVLSDIDEQTALLGFCWSWAENQIACASKAMPMGQTDGQKILQQLIPLLTRVCDVAQNIEDEQIGTGLMGLAMASSLHEQQYSRLFRS
ncbi:urease accessory protein UreF [Bacterioplanoides sp.]|uniref:urease accessory protein UreF n=1 Tax=Bacterioplanoides sp. TaxID=2066072 RepID=UPI003AFFB938